MTKAVMNFRKLAIVIILRYHSPNSVPNSPTLLDSQALGWEPKLRVLPVGSGRGKPFLLLLDKDLLASTSSLPA